MKRSYHQAFEGARQFATGVYRGWRAVQMARNLRGKRPRVLSGRKVGVKQPYRGGGSRTLTKQKDVGVNKRRKLSSKKKRQIRWTKKVQRAATANDILCIGNEQANGTVTPIPHSDQRWQQPIATASSTMSDFRINHFSTTASGWRKILADAIDEPDAPGDPSKFTGVLDIIKFQITHVDCNISILNVTNRPVPETYLGDKPYALFVDIYECVAASDIADAQFRTAYEAWVACNTNNTKAMSGSDATLAALLPEVSGVTPYQTRGFNKYWKILKKTRVYIGPEECINYSFSGRKGYFNLAKSDGKFCVKGWTKDLIIVANPTRNENLVSTQIPINVTWSKNYNFKLPEAPGLQVGWKTAYSYT